MTHWMCVNCGYYLQIEQPPNRCPSCKQACVFNNVTCYRPDCGGERNIDPLMVGAILGNLRRPEAAGKKAAGLSAMENTAPLAVGILDGLNEEQKLKFRELGHVEVYEAGAIICRQGEKSEEIYLVEEGQAIIQSELGVGARIPLTTVSEGQAFGWSTLVPPYILTASVSAAQKTRVLAVEKDPLLSLMRSDLAIGYTIMQNVAAVIAIRLRSVELEMIGFIAENRNKQK